MHVAVSRCARHTRTNINIKYASARYFSIWIDFIVYLVCSETHVRIYACLMAPTDNAIIMQTILGVERWHKVFFLLVVCALF